jgi:hypothetical protein
MLAYIVRSVTAFAIKAKARALAITVSDAPTVSTQASPIAPRPSLRLLDASSCPTLPVRQSHSLPQHPSGAIVKTLPTTYWGLAGTTQSMQIIEA